MRSRLEPSILLEWNGRIKTLWIPSANFNVVVAASTLWYIGCRWLRNSQQKFLPSRFDISKQTLQHNDFILQSNGSRFQFRKLRLDLHAICLRRCFQLTLQLSHLRPSLFTESILFSAFNLKFSQDASSLFIKSSQAGEVDCHSLLCSAAHKYFWVFSKCLDINHAENVAGNSIFGCSKQLRRDS